MKGKYFTFHFYKSKLLNYWNNESIIVKGGLIAFGVWLAYVVAHFAAIVIIAMLGVV